MLNGKQRLKADQNPAKNHRRRPKGRRVDGSAFVMRIGPREFMPVDESEEMTKISRLPVRDILSLK